MRTIVHVYPSYTEATHVVTALEAAGIPHDQISIVSGDGNRDDAHTDTTTGMTSGDPAQGAATGAGTGATVGTVLGGGAGLLAGIGSLAIPGIGPIVAAGWLVAALTGAGVGAATGGLIGSLTGAGVSEADAKTYEKGVTDGGTLVTVRADESQAAHVEQVMGLRTDTATTHVTPSAAGTAQPMPMPDHSRTVGSTATQPMPGETRTVGSAAAQPESTAQRDAETTSRT